MSETYRLNLGPQDGARVRIGGDQDMPQTIYVGPKWLGDGYAAWGSEKCGRFPARYDKRPVGLNYDYNPEKPNA